MVVNTVGSICSGIEAASVAMNPLGLSVNWFSEIADFPSKLLSIRYPYTPNLGDMCNIPDNLQNQNIIAPDLICGGTPCQAFSFAGLKQGLNDDRGNLTLQFVDIINTNDDIRKSQNKEPTVVLWENVEGVLSDKTNAFGCFISALAGLDNILTTNKKWSNVGIIHGNKRNVAWRVLDAKYFGIPQQRKRLYVIAGGTNFYPENILLEPYEHPLFTYPKSPLQFNKHGHKFEVFREYTDCLYSAYGTKWNGNAAAYNGSLYVLQDDKLRRLTPIECERLMNFPDDYTNIAQVTNTNRYKAIGNSWAVPVISWICKRLLNYTDSKSILENDYFMYNQVIESDDNIVTTLSGNIYNCSTQPNDCIFGSMQDIVEVCTDERLFISAKACKGILRRKSERKINMNKRLQGVMEDICNMSI